MEVSVLDVCFSLPLRGSSPPPANHPYVITCGTVKKLSKMAGNSPSKPLNSTPNELPCITVEWWRIAWKSSMHSQDTQHLIFQIGISKYL